MFCKYRLYLYQLFLGIFILPITPISLKGQTWQEILAATASDGAASDFFGQSVAVDGDYAIIGALFEDQDAAGNNTLNNAGAAYMFERNGDTWVQVQKIVASDRAIDDNFGRAVAISGDYAVIGTAYEDEDESGGNTLSDAGSVYIFHRSGGVWTQMQKIVASDRAANDNFGYSVSISGDDLLVGAFAEDEDEGGGNTLNSAGSVYLFTRSGSTWTEVQKIVAGDREAGNSFGWSVAISGNYALVGVYLESEDEAGTNSLQSAGAAYFFEKSGSFFSQMQKIVPSDRAKDDYFGYSVDLSGTRAIIGAYGEDEDDTGGSTLDFAGSAYIFSLSGGVWTEEQKLIADDRALEDNFSWSVGISGDYAVVGAYQEDEDYAGGNTLLTAGSAYIFKQTGGVWTSLQKITASDRATLNRFGHCVAISGNDILVGAMSKNSSQGGAYFWDGFWTYPEHGGYSLNFDGNDDHVEVEYDSTLNPVTFTVECWAKVEQGSGNWRSPLSSMDYNGGNTSGYAIYAGADDTWYIQTGDGSGSWNVTSSGVSVVENQWIHLAFTYDGSDLRIYTDGVLRATQTLTFVPNATAALRIGVDGDTILPQYFPGEVDEVRIWKTVRTLAEIMRYMHKEITGNESGLTAYYPMYDGSSTTLTDNSGHSRGGIFNDSPTWQASGAHAGPDMALDFDGTDDYVQLPADLLDLSNPFTLEAWIYPTDFAQVATWQRRVIFLTGVLNFALAVYEDQTIVFRSTNGPVTFATTETIAANTWTHLALAFDGTDYTLYLNGQEATLNAGGMANAGNGSFSAIGCTSNGEGPFQGKIDEVRLWDDVRTPEEIRAKMYHALDGDEANLVAYYRFDEQADATNTTLYDLTDNEYDGTLTNMDAATDWVTADNFNTWVGSEDGDWSLAANWSRNAAPTAEDAGVYQWSATILPASGNTNARHFYLDAGVTLSTTGNLTLSGDLYNAGTYTSSGTNTFSGSNVQNIRGTGTTTFGTFTINNPEGVILHQNLSTTTSLTLTNGILSLNSQTLTLGESSAVSGSPDFSRHVNATSGSLRKNYSGSGSFLFPVGDSTLYSPITLNFTSGTFSSGFASVGLTPAKHPNNGSVSHFINRYWSVTSGGISSFLCDVSAQYDDMDISGTENVLHGGKWNGASWLSLGSVNDGANTVIGTVNSFSDFTAAEETTLPVNEIPAQEETKIPSPAPGIYFYPNPTEDQLTLELPEEGWKGEIQDIRGRMAISLRLKEKKETISLNTLTSGVYILQLTSPRGEKWQQKIVKP